MKYKVPTDDDLKKRAKSMNLLKIFTGGFTAFFLGASLIQPFYMVFVIAFSVLFIASILIYNQNMMMLENRRLARNNTWYRSKRQIKIPGWGS